MLRKYQFSILHTKIVIRQENIKLEKTAAVSLQS